MDIVFIPFIILGGSFLLLRKVFLKPEETQPTPVQLVLVGIVSWVFVLSAFAWLLLPLYLIYLLLVEGVLGAVMPLALFAIATGFAFQLNETLDSATVLHYVHESALFHPIKPHYMHIQEELDKKTIRDVHRETSDKPFPTAGKQKRLLTEKEAREYKGQMSAARERPIKSRHFNEEIASLKSGATTSLADGWKVYTFDHKLHDFYVEMSRLRIDPGIRALQFNLTIPNATEGASQDPMYLYQLKQELYHLFSVLHTDLWLAPYSEHFDRISTVCYGIEPDSFGVAQLYPFMRLEIPSSELHRLEGKFFNAADLHTISTLIFNNGKPLMEEIL
jgi:hypothetical protein